MHVRKNAENVKQKMMLIVRKLPKTSFYAKWKTWKQGRLNFWSQSPNVMIVSVANHEESPMSEKLSKSQKSWICQNKTSLKKRNKKKPKRLLWSGKDVWKKTGDYGRSK